MGVGWKIWGINPKNQDNFGKIFGNLENIFGKSVSVGVLIHENPLKKKQKNC